MGGVEGVVRPLQLLGHHQRGVRHGHRHDARRQPPRRRDGGQQHAERHAAERREDERRASPAKPPRSAQASANSGRTKANSAFAGRATRESHPRASAASTGTAHSARYVRPWVLARSAARATSTKAITDAGGTAAQRRFDSRASRGAGQSARNRDHDPLGRDSKAIDVQKGSITGQH